MKKDIIFSIVMPVYNTANYLDESIGSVLKQNASNWELICINDGSTDESLDILMKYAGLDKRIKVKDIPNSGPANARNIGISETTGEYILFLDSDDTLNINSIDKLSRVVMEKDYDVVTFSAETNSTSLEMNWTIPNMNASNAEYWGKDCANCLFWEQSTRPFIWNKAYKREFIVRNSINFDRNITLGEDQAFLFNVFQKAKHVKFVDIPLYKYKFQRDGSIMTLLKKDKYISTKNHLLLVKNVIINMYKNDNLKAHSDEIMQWAVSLLYNIYIKELKLSQARKLSKEFIEFINEYQIEKIINIYSWDIPNISDFTILKYLAEDFNLDYTVVLHENGSKYFSNVTEFFNTKIEKNGELILICLSMNFYRYACDNEQFKKFTKILLPGYSFGNAISTYVKYCSSKSCLIASYDGPMTTNAISLSALYRDLVNCKSNVIVGVTASELKKLKLNIDDSIEFNKLPRLFNIGNMLFKTSFLQNSNVVYPNYEPYSACIYAMEVIRDNNISFSKQRLVDVKNDRLEQIKFDVSYNINGYITALGVLGVTSLNINNYYFAKKICDILFKNDIVNVEKTYEMKPENFDKYCALASILPLAEYCFENLGLYEEHRNYLQSIIDKLEEYDENNVESLTFNEKKLDCIKNSRALELGFKFAKKVSQVLWRK